MPFFKTKKLGSLVVYHVLFKDKKGTCKDAPDEDGLKLIGIFPPQSLTIATYDLEMWLNSQYLNWFFNERYDEYQLQDTRECVGRIKKVRG